MLITKFYDAYLDESGETPNPNKEVLLDLLSQKLNEEELMTAESIITELEDTGSEKAFIAGFKKAFELITEVMA